MTDKSNHRHFHEGSEIGIDKQQSKQPARTSTLAKWFSLDITANEQLTREGQPPCELPQEHTSKPDQAGHPFCYLWSAKDPQRAESGLGSLREMVSGRAQLPNWRDVEKQNRDDQTSSQAESDASQSLAKADTSNQRCKKRRRRTFDEPERKSSKADSSTSTALTCSWACILVMVLSCGVAFISYLDRAILGVTILPMAAELGWDESFEGAISR